MKIKTSSLIAICMLTAAGATGTPERISEKPALETEVDATSAVAGATERSDASSKWQYMPASNYVAPKAPI